MRQIPRIFSNEKGSTIVAALMILVILTIIGISATTTSNIELQIATNDMRHKMSFYAADGGTELGSEIVEQSLGCTDGFSVTTLDKVEVTNSSIYKNTDSDATPPSDSNRDAYFPTGYSAGQPHINFKMGGNTEFSTGSALQMAAGYEGKGKGVAAGGAYIAYDVYAQHLGHFNTESTVLLQWRHMIGQEGDCNY